jgi:hypothetical protein
MLQHRRFSILSRLTIPNAVRLKVRRPLRAVFPAILCAWVVPAPAFAQGVVIPPTDTTRESIVVTSPWDSSLALDPSALILVTDEFVDRLRSSQLRAGVAPGQSLLLRSASSLTRRLAGSQGGAHATGLAPQFLAVVNSQMPFSQNNGALWAGKGLSTRTLFGFRLEGARALLLVAPEVVLSGNSDWLLRHDFYAPDVPPDRSKFDLPYYVGNFTIDQPMRFGDKAIRRLDLGETTALLNVRQAEIGFSNENEWWGPGIRNAIVLSNNAPGFPHLFLRTAHPLASRFGWIDMRWLVGGLKESPYFDTVSTNNVRSLASIAATLQTRWDPNLSFGFARSVYSTATGWGQVPWRWFDAFERTSDTVNRSVKKDQLFSLFTRWVFPADGVEVYAELARIRLKPSSRTIRRDIRSAPNGAAEIGAGATSAFKPKSPSSSKVQRFAMVRCRRGTPAPGSFRGTRTVARCLAHRSGLVRQASLSRQTT